MHCTLYTIHYHILHATQGTSLPTQKLTICWMSSEWTLLPLYHRYIIS